MQNIQENKTIEKLLKARRVSFIVNIAITFVSIIGVLALMVFNTFLDNILEGNKKIIFYAIIVFGLVFWLAFVLIDRLVKLSEKETLYLAVAGTKKEYVFYSEYPNPNEENVATDIETNNEEDANSSEELSSEENNTEKVEEVKEASNEPLTRQKYKKSNKVILFSVFSNFGDIYSVICAAFFVVAIMFCFFLFPATVVGECMEPLLYPESFSREADKILAIKNAKFETGDVVVFEYDYAIQDNNTNIVQDELLIKRVIASPGQKFEVRSGVVYIDDVAIEEDYVKYAYSAYTNYDVSTIIYNNTNKDSIEYNNDNIVPEGYYILLGDNRVVANDSHYFGLVSENQICGTVKYYKNAEGWHKLDN